MDLYFHSVLRSLEDTAITLNTLLTALTIEVMKNVIENKNNGFANLLNCRLYGI